MKTQPLGPFLGINNRKPDFALTVATRQLNGQYLRTANNVEIDPAGKIRRRGATSLVQAMAGAHSIYMQTETAGFLVRSSVLYAITLPTYTEVLKKVLSNDLPLSYAELGDTLYFSNGTDNGRITAGVYAPMSLATPPTPTLSAIGGSLLAGSYQVGISYRVANDSSTGEEGCISASANIDLAATGGIRVTLPSAVPGASYISVHMSHANGTMVYYSTTVAVGTASVDLTTLPTGHEAQQRFDDVLPPGKLFVSNGRLCSYAGNMVYVGLPFRPGYYLPHEGYIPFQKPVSVCIENQNGTFIAADNTYWVPGDLGDVKENIVKVLPYGAVPGTEFRFKNNTVCGWFGPKGLVVGQINGEVEAVMSENIALVAPVSGFSTLIVDDTDDEFFRVMSCGWTVNLSSNAATTYSGWGITSSSGKYGTKTDGIYLLNSDGLVDISIGFGKVDFGTELMKHLPNVYLGVNASQPMSLTVKAPKGVEFTYSARAGSNDMQVQRIDPGKGLRANWFDLTLTNTMGSDFTLASVSFAPTISSRRI